VVVEHDVSGLERLDAELLQRPPDDEQARPELRGTELGLADHRPPAGEEDAREVEALVEDRREGSPDHREAHFGADVHQAVVDDRQRAGVDRSSLAGEGGLRAHRVSSSTPSGAPSSRHSGGTRTVESIDSTTSGPCCARTASRRTTGVAINPCPGKKSRRSGVRSCGPTSSAGSSSCVIARPDPTTTTVMRTSSTPIPWNR